MMPFFLVFLSKIGFKKKFTKSINTQSRDQEKEVHFEHVSVCVCHTEWSKSDRERHIVWYHLYEESKKKSTNELIYKIEIVTDV